VNLYRGQCPPLTALQRWQARIYMCRTGGAQQSTGGNNKGSLLCADAHQGLCKGQTHLRVIREATNAIPGSQAASACVALRNFLPGLALVWLS
jgi:hypothetical protein